jgi:hypothetical protein
MKRASLNMYTMWNSAPRICQPPAFPQGLIRSHQMCDHVANGGLGEIWIAMLEKSRNP